jgi:thiamine pyrophosphate-dependent acetolactate synthase large subunit-like protein
MVGGYAERVERPADLEPALREALHSLHAGKTAILNFIMPDQADLR